MQTINGKEVSEIGSATEYMEQVLGMTEEEIELAAEEQEEFCQELTEMIALLYSHKSLRNTSHICGSLPDAVFDMIRQKEKTLQEKYDLTFERKLFQYY